MSTLQNITCSGGVTEQRESYNKLYLYRFIPPKTQKELLLVLFDVIVVPSLLSLSSMECCGRGRGEEKDL